MFALLADPRLWSLSFTSPRPACLFRSCPASESWGSFLHRPKTCLSVETLVRAQRVRWLARPHRHELSSASLHQVPWVAVPWWSSVASEDPYLSDLSRSLRELRSRSRGTSEKVSQVPGETLCVCALRSTTPVRPSDATTNRRQVLPTFPSRRAALTTIPISGLHNAAHTLPVYASPRRVTPTRRNTRFWRWSALPDAHLPDGPCAIGFPTRFSMSTSSSSFQV